MMQTPFRRPTFRRSTVRLDRRRAVLAILATAPFTTLGAWISLFLAPGTVGTIGMVICQICFISHAIAWTVYIDHQPLKLPPPKPVDWRVGGWLSLLMAGIILLSYWLIGRHWIDPNIVQSGMVQIGTRNPWILTIACLYFSFVNAFIEEYIWRRFMLHQCQKLAPKNLAILLSALLFTTHHIIILLAYTPLPVILGGSLGVFSAGAIWSWYYLHYRSLWGCYFSHVAADLALYFITFILLWG
ncbi:MAG: type II CAAX endopeptidase family protein [Synechococcales bacterium]|nr:type II CAAX endopeptidase family protein [Synechococcales bacterium]